LAVRGRSDDTSGPPLPERELMRRLIRFTRTPDAQPPTEDEKRVLDACAWTTMHEGGPVLREGNPPLVGAKLDPSYLAELEKKVVGLANADGGLIVIGAREGDNTTGLSNEESSAIDHTPIQERLRKDLKVDPPAVTVYDSPSEDGAEVRRVLIVQRARRQPLVFREAASCQDKKQNPPFHAGQIWVAREGRIRPATCEDVWEMQERMLESPLAALEPEELVAESYKLAASDPGKVDRYIAELHSWMDGTWREALETGEPANEAAASLLGPALRKLTYVAAGVAKHRNLELWVRCCRVYADVYSWAGARGVPFAPAELALRHVYVAGACAIAADAPELAVNLVKVSVPGVHRPLVANPCWSDGRTGHRNLADLWAGTVSEASADTVLQNAVQPARADDSTDLTALLCQFSFLATVTYWDAGLGLARPYPGWVMYHRPRCLHTAEEMITHPDRYPVHPDGPHRLLLRVLVQAEQRYANTGYDVDLSLPSSRTIERFVRECEQHHPEWCNEAKGD